MDRDALLQKARALQALLAGVDNLPEAEAACAELRALCERSSGKVSDLTYVVVMGPTGCGKSKVTNSVFGRSICPVGYRRPTTFTPYVIAPQGSGASVAGSLSRLAFELVELDGEHALPLVVVDTPDIDSIRKENRHLTESFLNLADAVLVVVDPTKYADESIWYYLRRFARHGTVYRVVLNKLKCGEVLYDVKKKFEVEGLRADVVALPFQAGPDHTLLPACEGLAALRSQLADWAHSAELRNSAYTRSLHAVQKNLTEVLCPRLRSYEKQLQDFQEHIAPLLRRRERDLAQGLTLSFDPHTQAAVYAKVLGNLERIDPLRLPRRLITAPLRFLKHRFGMARTEATEAPEVRSVLDVREEHFLTIAAETAAALEGAFEEIALAPPSLPSEAHLREAFRSFTRRFGEQVKEEAETLAGTLTPGQRVRFYLAQALLVGALLGVGLHTGGVLTFTELLTGGLLSPFAAKLLTAVLSSEETRRFFQRMSKAYVQGAVSVLRTSFGEVERSVQRRHRRIGELRSEAESLAALLRESTQGA